MKMLALHVYMYHKILLRSWEKQLKQWKYESVEFILYILCFTDVLLFVNKLFHDPIISAVPNISIWASYTDQSYNHIIVSLCDYYYAMIFQDQISSIVSKNIRGLSQFTFPDQIIFHPNTMPDHNHLLFL